MTETIIKTTRPESKTGLWIAILLPLFLLAAAATAFFTYRTVRELIATWELTNLPGFQVRPAAATASPNQEPGVVLENVPEVLPPALIPEPWDGASRVSVLVMGLDYRDWQNGEGPPRTDTMILLTIDPLSLTAGMLTIPRDLWVNIPGFEPGRINTAYRLGEVYKLPGGGPGLAMDTVEALLGVPIDYYAQIDFSAFVRFIDEIGGIKVDVPEPIKVDLIGDGRETIKSLDAGRQTLPGEWALAYARARYTEGGDFDRSMRQIQVIMGIRDRLINVEMIPTLIQKAPILYRELSSGIHTNLDLEQAIRLGLLAAEVPEEHIKRGIIGAQQIVFGKSAEGDDVLKPLPERIRQLRDEIFTTDSAIGPSATTEDLLSMVSAENARVAVRNGTSISGLATRTAEYFRSQGLNIPEELVGDGTASVYTQIIMHSGNPYTLRYLIETMNISKNNIRLVYEPGNPTDIELVVGNDWANNNPMP